MERELVCQRLPRADHGVLKVPADPGGIGAKRRSDPDRQTLLGEVEVFEDPAARPVTIRAILEHHVDERIAKEREAPYDLRTRHRKEGRGKRVGDMILDDLRGLSWVFG